MSSTIPPLNVSRRQFLGRTAQNAAGLAAGLVGLSAAAHETAGEPVRLGVIGVRRQGRKLATEFAKLPGAAVVALCDIDEAVLARASKEVAETGQKPRAERDFVRVLHDPKIDAVVIATPDHSHVAIAVEAMRCGKDVYLETPVCHTIAEGAALLATAEATGRIVQSGLFDRSLAHVRSAVEFVRSGRLGAVPIAKAWAVHRSIAGHPAAESAMAPAGVDYDRWLFPAPERPFDARRFHRGWADCWDYGSGELGNWGSPLLDIARWGLGVELPERVTAAGGHVAGDGEAPDTLHVTYAFPNAAITWEHRRWSNHPPEGRSNGVAFYGQRGTLVLDRGGWKVYDAAEPAGENGRADLTPHLRDFLDAVRMRRPTAAPAEIGVTSAALCHYGNLAYRLGREVRIDPTTGSASADPEIAALCAANYRPGVQVG